jgi:hypothetical protein
MAGPSGRPTKVTADFRLPGNQLPSLEKISSQEEFGTELIDSEAFERAWIEAQANP